MALRLRPLLPADEAAFIAGHHAMQAEGFVFALRYEEGMPWADFVEIHRLQLARTDLPGRLVPSTFLVAEADGQIVGRVSIRHELNEWLEQQGGHIGYGVLPEHRRRGHATTILRQSIIIARSHGVDRVLVTCDDDNEPSARTIERCGGVLDSIVTADGGQPVRRYWID